MTHQWHSIDNRWTTKNHTLHSMIINEHTLRCVLRGPRLWKLAKNEHTLRFNEKGLFIHRGPPAYMYFVHIHLYEYIYGGFQTTNQRYVVLRSSQHVWGRVKNAGSRKVPGRFPEGSRRFPEGSRKRSRKRPVNEHVCREHSQPVTHYVYIYRHIHMHVYMYIHIHLCIHVYLYI